jgi:hypothetical protein
LSYYSQVNKGIRSYNEKLREITKEHKQVALIEIDIDRKYHTRHGLHFNKLDKLLFSNKITQMIYLILGDKQKQSIVMSENYGNQGDESEVDGRNSNQVNKDIRNSEDIIKLTQNGEEKFNQDEDEIRSDNSDDKNGEVRFGQIMNKVILTQELECDKENKGVNRDKCVIFSKHRILQTIPNLIV